MTRRRATGTATASARTLIGRLEALKTRFSAEETEAKLALLTDLRQTRISDPKVLIRYHEALLFIRAYPDDRRVFDLARRECEAFGARVDHVRSIDPDGAWDELEDTGLVNTGMYYAYDYAVVIWLVRWYGDALEIDWDSFEDTEKLDHMLPLLGEWVENDGLDLAGNSTQEWLESRRGDGSDGSVTPARAAPRSCLRWLLEAMERSIPSFAVRAKLYDSLDLPIVWQIGNAPAARTHSGSAARRPFFHRDGLLKRVPDFRGEITKPLATLRHAGPSAAGALIKTLRSTLSVRHRALYPVDYANRTEVVVSDVGRGYRLVLIGMQPEARLPIESDYAALILKNGFVFGYGVGALLFEQMEIAVNIFDTWRGSETRFVFAGFMRTFYQHFGCTRFKIERYQVGWENEEGIQSGAFWFYYGLGFVPKLPAARTLARREQAKIDKNRAYRSPVSVLEKLAESDLYLTLGGGARAIPDDFPVSDLSLRTTRMIGKRFDGDGPRAADACAEAVARALPCRGWKSWSRGEREGFRRLSLILAQIPDLSRWSPGDRKALAAIMRAKGARREAEYARLVARHGKLRSALEKVARG